METNNLLFTSRISPSETDDNKRCYLCLRLYLFIIIFYKYPKSQILRNETNYRIIIPKFRIIF